MPPLYLSSRAEPASPYVGEVSLQANGHEASIGERPAFLRPLAFRGISFSYRQAQIFPVDVIPSQTEDSTRDAREGTTIVPDVHRSTGGP